MCAVYTETVQILSSQALPNFNVGPRLTRSHKLQPALLRLSAIISQYFTRGHLCAFTMKRAT
jgi:hypothetical protein